MESKTENSVEASSSNNDRWPSFLSHPIAIAISAILFVCLASATGFRIHKEYASAEMTEFDWTLRGHSDFHNGIYLPSQAFIAGVNPFSKDAVEQYLMTRACPPYSPVTFMLHSPFALFNVYAADVLFYLYNLGLALLLGYCGITMSGGRFRWFAFFALGCLVLISRPGHITLFTGYFTLELVLGTIVALHFAKTKPMLSGLGMLLASSKPTYIVPLVFMMMWRKNYKATIIGCILCGVFAAGGIAWLSYHSSLDSVIAGIQQGQDDHIEDVTEYPINTWTRIDLLGMFAKTINWNPATKIYLIAMFFLMIIPGLAVARATHLESNTGGCGLTAWIVVLSMLVCLYHHSYDCLLLVAPWIGVTFFGRQTLPELGSFARRTIALLTAIPAGNYLSTQTARDRLGFEQLDIGWQAITMINGTCLLIALAILIYHAFKLPKQAIGASPSE